MGLKVNGEEITAEAVEFELRRLVDFFSQHMPPEKLEEEMGALRKRAAMQAIGMQLLIVEADRRHFTVPQGDIASRVEEMVTGAGGDEALDQILAKQGLTRDALGQSIVQGRKVDLLVEEITAAVVPPTEEEMVAYYQKNTSNYARPGRTLVQHILLKPDSDSEEDRSAARERLLGIRERADAGEDFAELAREHSECPTGKQNGGSLGWVSRGTMLPEFEDVLFSTGLETTSDVVETSLGMHIIRPLERQDEKTASFDEARESICELLLHDRKGKELSDFVEKLKAAATIDYE